MKQWWTRTDGGNSKSQLCWEVHCNAILTKAGFEPIGAEWPSTFFHPALRLLLAVYMDDFKMAGPKENLEEGWRLIGERIEIEPPTGFGLYLGCNHKRSTTTTPDGHEITTMEYDMSDFLRQCVAKYRELADFAGEFPPAPTPFLTASAEHGPARVPSESVSGVTPGADDGGGTDESRGELAAVAAKVIMKVLYAARMARYDLLRAVQGLARYMTKWTRKNDAELFRLMAYVHHTTDVTMRGWVGDDLAAIELQLYSDADFAGCQETQKSTSGMYLGIRGERTSFPVAAYSKKQHCVSTSTTEAEMVAAATAMKTIGLPMLMLMGRLRAAHAQPDPTLWFRLDNQAMIEIARTGRNLTMRHLNRTHGVHVAWLREQCERNAVKADSLPPSPGEQPADRRS